MNLSERRERARKANALLQVIASVGRGFFGHQGRVSRLEVDERGRVWLIDKYTLRRIFTHRRGERWRGFSEGGTLRDVVERLVGFVVTGKPITAMILGPWPDRYCGGEMWGYGKENMAFLRKAASQLGVVAFAKPAPVVSRPAKVLAWAVANFGDCATERLERAARVAEEGIEIAQAEGLPGEVVGRILERVYSREPGELGQEIGGLALCLEACAENAGLDLESEARREWERISSLPKEWWEKKHAEKVSAGTANLSVTS